MCIYRIIDYVSDYELGVYSSNTDRFYYCNLNEINNFSECVITELESVFGEKFQLLSYSPKKIKANIFGKFHAIELDYDESADIYMWIVIIGSDDDDY